MKRRQLVTWLIISGGISSLAVADSSNKKDIIDTAVSNGNFTILAKTLEAADLIDALRAEGPFTVLAPTDDAFGKLPKELLGDLLKPQNRDKLTKILTYHVIAGNVSARAALNAERANTLADESLRFGLKGGQLVVNDSRVVINDLKTSNGIIHVIDTVLIPPTSSPAVDSVESLVRLAINRGVPLFNAGQAEACAAVYEVTSQALLALSDDQISSDAREALTQALNRAADQSDARVRAWTLREGLDQVLRNSSDDDRVANAAGDSWGKLRMLTDFTDSNSGSIWRTVNDNVMGGRSSGGAQFSPGMLTFAGSTNTNGGGFSSIRKPVSGAQLAAEEGLVVRYRGDGRPFKANLETTQCYNGRPVSYWVEFDTVADGQWREVRLPFEAFEPVVWGRSVRGRVPEFSPSIISSVGFLIYDKKDGPFKLEVDWIQTYSQG